MSLSPGPKLNGALHQATGAINRAHLPVASRHGDVASAGGRVRLRGKLGQRQAKAYH
jgi:hypothetical protein